ncbi:MAG TPA: hypothetical protein VHJ59_07335 [Nitrososphaera sp.]|jgi:hypothetical protein|nr:hypothetical protein [Nitrososphaera sp.]
MSIEEQVDYQRVEKFLEKLLGTHEYYIDPKISEIPYQGGSLGQKLSEALDTYQKAKIFSVSRIPTPGIVTIAVNAITAALLHGVVIDKEDLRKQLKDAESRLGEC